MGTLASELGGYAERVSGQPRVYVDANVPAGLVSFMRQALHWDVLFVLEHEELRRASDGEHFRLARTTSQDAHHAGPRLPRRSKISSTRERWRAGHLGAGRKRIDGAAQAR